MKSTFPLFERNISWSLWVPRVRNSCPFTRRRCRAPRAATFSTWRALVPSAGGWAQYRMPGGRECGGRRGRGRGPARRSRVPVDDRREHQDELLSSVYVNINDSYSLWTCISVYVCVTRSAVSDFLRPTSRIAGRFFTI